MEIHDCHVHMVLDGINWKEAIGRHKPKPDEDFIRNTLSKYAEIGTVYLREGGDKFGAGWLARSIAPEYGIAYASPVFPIHQKGNYGSFIGRAFETIDDFKAMVDEISDAGGDYVKVMLSGIMDFNEFGKITGHSLPRDLVEQMIGYAHSKGLAVMAHVNGARAVQDAVEAGVDSVEHGYFSDEESRKVLAESDTIWVPTFAPICNLIGTGHYPDDVLKRIADMQMKAVAEVAAMGGTIASGSDAGAGDVLHADAAKQELGYMKQALGEGFEEVVSRGYDAMRAKFSPRI
ncbi:MAG: amidohydrolase family protein [Coriobacteriales bacterium]